jgi:hypothetical protein
LGVGETNDLELLGVIFGAEVEVLIEESKDA